MGRRYPLKPLAAAGLIVVLSGCMSHAPSPDAAPVAPPRDLESLPDPVATDEPRSAWGNQTYTVRGRTFEILPTAAGYDYIGEASWYGTKFHGRRTANGERYDMYELTAAHTTLPIPTYVRVTNLENGRQTVVRINDRGPFHGGRFIDLSYAAAVKLGMTKRGTARVRVTAVGENDRQKAQGPVAQNLGAGRYFLQAGAFAELWRADNLTAALKEIVGTDVHVVRTPDDRLYRVRIGPFSTRQEAQQLQARVASRHNSAPVIIEE